MAPFSKLWISFEEAIAHESNIVHMNLVEIIQYLEQPVML